MKHDVRLERLASRPLAVVRRRVSPKELARFVPEACGLVWGAIRARNRTDAGRHVAVYLDDQINLEVGVELDAPFEADGDGEVVSSATPAGLVATTTHFGPYGLLDEAHQAVCRWISENGYEPAGPSWEIYGHWTAECNSDPSKIRTDVGYLLKTDDGSTAAP